MAVAGLTGAGTVKQACKLPAPDGYVEPQWGKNDAQRLVRELEPDMGSSMTSSDIISL